jgi:hypothetical protein
LLAGTAVPGAGETGTRRDLLCFGAVTLFFGSSARRTVIQPFFTSPLQSAEGEHRNHNARTSVELV